MVTIDELLLFDPKLEAWRHKMFHIFTLTLWSASYPACVVYTKTIIHLSVSESGGYLRKY